MPTQQLESIREVLLPQFTEQRSKFDSRDIKLLFNDLFITRFLNNNNHDFERTVLKLTKCFEWRSSSKINDLTGEDFPKEFFENGMFKVGRDSSSNHILLYKPGLHRKNVEFTELKVLFFAFIIESNMNEENGSLAIDLNGASYSTLDTDYVMAIIKLFSNYPGTFCKVFIFGVSRSFQSIINFVIGFLPEKYKQRVNFINDNQAKELLFNGTQLIATPDDCESLDVVARRRGMSQAAIDVEIENQKSVEKFFEVLNK